VDRRADGTTRLLLRLRLSPHAHRANHK
jgi:hypothetical protein